jgi:subtilase family serine protease
LRFHRFGRVTLVAAASFLCIGSTAYAGSGSATVSTPDSRVSLPGSVPAWAAAADLAGSPPPGASVTINVGLALHDADAASKLALAVSDPRSSSYGHYLTPAQFNAKYAPSAASVTAVKKFLTDSGLKVGSIAEGNRWIPATGTVAQVNKAFATTMHTYRWRGATLNAPSTMVSIPSTLANDVLTVTGLDDSGQLRRPYSAQISPDITAPRVTTSSAKPPKATECSTYWAQHSQTVPAAYGATKFPTYICGYTGKQLRSAYGVSSAVTSGRDGRGVTVAILDAYASPTIVSDANKYAKATGEPGFAAGQFTQTVFKPFGMQKDCGGEAGWNEEQTLDVEAVHSVAPGASIHYIGAKDCDSGLDDALNYVVQHHTADIVSNSYGYAGEDVPPATMKLDESLFTQAAAEGIGVYFSSGDSGDEVTIGNTTSAQPDFPASSPMVTGVGGTSLAITKSNGYSFETGWGSEHDLVGFTGKKAAYETPLPGYYLFGAGGGTSTAFAQPSYQAGRVPAALSQRYGNTAARVVPDVAAVADPYTGFLIGETSAGVFSLAAIGGTSLACPTFAAIQALASTGRKTSIGFANPLLYSVPASAFHDVKPRRAPVAVSSPTGGSLTTFDQDSSLQTSYGFDDVTGRGTPVGAALLNAEAVWH